MIELDPDSSTPVWEQLFDRFSFLIATGQYSTGDVLPSTRALGKQLGISFHTVRRAYTALSEAALAKVHPGRGFVVGEYKPPARQERLEDGASIMATAVQRLVAMGLGDDEIEYLLQERLSQLDASPDASKIIFVGTYTEMAEGGARRVSEYLGATVEAVPLALIDDHLDAEYALCPFQAVRAVREKLPRADVTGLRLELPPEAVELTCRLFPHETVLLVVRYADAVPHLSRHLRNDAGFGGQLIASVMDEDDSRLGALVRQSDAVVFTPETSRRIRPHLAGAATSAAIELAVPRTELERLRLLLPR